VAELFLRNASLPHLQTGEVRVGDVVIRDGEVAVVGGVDDVHPGAIVIDLAGAWVVPGFVDLHAHVFDGVGDAVAADEACLARGTLTAVDAGTAGAATIDAFRRVAAEARTEVLAWLNLATIGLADTRVGELLIGPYLDVEAAIRATNRHPGFVVGIKARLSTYAAGRGAGRVLDGLRAVADEVGLPVMVHVGDTDEPLEELVASLRPGDVVTHALTGRKHGILDAAGRLRPGIREAQAAGIVFDAARGMNHLSFAVLAGAVEQGFLPDTLSTDMTTALVRDPTFGLATIGTYLLAAGVPVHQVLDRMSVRPARVIGRETAPSVDAGQPADLTIVRLEPGPFTLEDVDGRKLSVAERLTAIGTVASGVYRAAGTPA
jgi:dihydroorotase